VLMAWMFIKPKANNEETKPSRYKQLVFWTVDNPRKALAALVPLILVTAVAIPYVAVNFIPQSDRSIVFLDYWLPNGAKIEQTSADMRKVEEWLVAQPEGESISSYVGTSAPRF
ncbi:efflux RND transporter permease subunit, partial [Escherichia coli]|nr:efflux RND transporter permease subunit [Escherichia coli]